MFFQRDIKYCLITPCAIPAESHLTNRFVWYSPQLPFSSFKMNHESKKTNSKTGTRILVKMIFVPFIYRILKKLLDFRFKPTLTRGGPDMSRILPFCRGFLEHLELTLTNKTFLVVSLDSYLHIERKRHSEKGHTANFQPFSSKMFESSR